MLDHEQNRRLDDLAEQTLRHDSRFAAALAQGRPCPPREYRSRRRAVLATVATAATTALLTGYVALTLLVILLLFAGSLLWDRSGLDTAPAPPRR